MKRLRFYGRQSGPSNLQHYSLYTRPEFRIALEVKKSTVSEEEETA